MVSTSIDKHKIDMRGITNFLGFLHSKPISDIAIKNTSLTNDTTRDVLTWMKKIGLGI